MTYPLRDDCTAMTTTTVGKEMLYGFEQESRARSLEPAPWTQAG